METSLGTLPNDIFFNIFMHFKSIGQASPFVKPQTKLKNFAIFLDGLMMVHWKEIKVFSCIQVKAFCQRLHNFLLQGSRFYDFSRFYRKEI